MLSPASFNTKALAISGVFILALMFGLASYLTSYLRGYISTDVFTISQSLAFGNKPGIIGLLILSMICIMILTYMRGPPGSLLWVRLFLLLVIYAIIATIVWITTYYNALDHYILASIAFTSSLIYIVLTCMLFYQNIKTKTLFRLFINMLYCVCRNIIFAP